MRTRLEVETPTRPPHLERTTKMQLPTGFLAALIAVTIPMSWGCGESSSGLASATVPATPEQARAAQDFFKALRLERAHKKAASLKAYRKVISDHPDSQQAKLAAERIHALGG